jgi:hypothetical protein
MNKMIYNLKSNNLKSINLISIYHNSLILKERRITMFNKKVIFIISLVFLMGNALFAQNDYIGAQKCKMCHNKEATGQQFAKWSASAHASAWKNLAGPKALEIGKAKGIANPQKDAKCLKCHTTTSLAVEEGVSCEACHGPGSAYKSVSIMKNRDMAIKNGLIVPTQKLCVKCHNPESPTYKAFDFASFAKKIEHKIPK